MKVNMKSDSGEIPQATIDMLARMILPHVIDFYESDEGKKFLEKWEEEQDGKE